MINKITNFFTLFVIVSNVIGQCPQNWISWRNKCYFKRESGTTFENSRIFCGGFNSEIITIESEEENNFVNEKVIGNGNWFWIGLQRNGTGNSQFVWHKEKPVTYSNWANGEPSSVTARNCTKIEKGKWYAIACSTSNGFDLCEKYNYTIGNLKENIEIMSRIFNDKYEIAMDQIQNLANNLWMSQVEIFQSRIMQNSSEVKSELVDMVQVINSSMWNEVNGLINITLKLATSQQEMSRRMDERKNLMHDSSQQLIRDTYNLIVVVITALTLCIAMIAVVLITVILWRRGNQLYLRRRLENEFELPKKDSF